ncbi:MAG: hypothetical protein K1000chlam3_00860 [Chlamydiae bacterium]|nr:hypothetical protein [Chlamydiota bacterium]
MRIHSAANKSPLFPYKTFFELHKLNLSLLRPPERLLGKKLGFWQRKQFTYTL